MREILVCNSSQRTWEGDRKVNKKCPACNREIIPINMSVKEWNSFSENQQNEIVDNITFYSDSTRYLRVSIVSGAYEDYPAYIDKIKNLIIVFMQNGIGQRVDDDQTIYKYFDIQMASEDVNIFDNSRQISLTVGGFAWIAVGLYNYANTGDGLELIAGAISGVIWGGVAWIIAKQFKKTEEIIRVMTNNEEVLELAKEPILSNYFWSLNSGLSSVQNKYVKKENFNNVVPISDKYDQLVKLKELLDRDILTKEEFELEKARLLSRENNG